MKTIFQKIEPVDIIASIIILGGLILVGTGVNGLVGTLLTAVTFFYFGDKNRSITMRPNDFQTKP